MPMLAVSGRPLFGFNAFLKRAEDLMLVTPLLLLIGPRAHPVSMMAGDKLYHEAVRGYIARHRVRPGITGWAQINGLRGEVDTLEKAKRRVELDLNYIENWSLMLDLEILIRTPL